MELTGRQVIAAPIDRTWVALNDPGTLKECIAGCESIDKTGDDEYAVVMAVRIGPVNAKFKGKLKLQNLQPPSSYTIAFEGQGGVAGFGKGSADVRLTPQGGNTTLDYTARATVGGKIAQIGSRLVDSAAKKMADDFFTAFNARMGGAAVPAAAVEEPAGGVAAAPAEPGQPGAPGEPAPVPAATPPSTVPAPAPRPSGPGGIPRWAWIAVAAAVALILLWSKR